MNTRSVVTQHLRRRRKAYRKRTVEEEAAAAEGGRFLLACLLMHTDLFLFVLTTKAHFYSGDHN